MQPKWAIIVVSERDMTNEIAHKVNFTIGNQTFTIETGGETSREGCNWFAEQLRTAFKAAGCETMLMRK